MSYSKRVKHNDRANLLFEQSYKAGHHMSALEWATHVAGNDSALRMLSHYDAELAGRCRKLLIFHFRASVITTLFLLHHDCAIFYFP